MKTADESTRFLTGQCPIPNHHFPIGRIRDSSIVSIVDIVISTTFLEIGVVRLVIGSCGGTESVLNRTHFSRFSDRNDDWLSWVVGGCNLHNAVVGLFDLCVTHKA